MRMPYPRRKSVAYLLLLVGGVFIVLTARSRRSLATNALTTEEQATLDKILGN